MTGPDPFVTIIARVVVIALVLAVLASLFGMVAMLLSRV